MRSICLYSNPLLMVSCVSVAFVEAGMILGFLLGAFSYKEVTPPDKRSLMSNMGGNVLRKYARHLTIKPLAFIVQKKRMEVSVVHR